MTNRHGDGGRSTRTARPWGDARGWWLSAALVAVLIALAGPGACKRSNPVAPSQPAAILGAFNHVVVVVEENEGYDQVMGNPAMPYLNGLATTYAQATQYYANSHPSIGNYFMMTVGDTITQDDNYSGMVNTDSVVRQLTAAGKTWKSYAEDLPSVGYTGFDVGSYVRRHNVLALLSDVAQNPTQAKNLVPFTQFAADLSANALPNYAFVVPNLCNDAHSCPLSVADTWLQTHVAPLIANAQFQRDGLLIIAFDEAESDATFGGGRVPWVVVSARTKRGYQSATFYQHESTLRLTLEALGISAWPNRAASAPSMSEFFN